MILEQFMALETKKNELELRADAEEKRLKQDLSFETRINIESQILIDQLKQRLFELEEKN